MKTRDFIGDAMGAVSINMIFNLAGMMIYFYTDIVGIAIGTVGTVLFLANIFDTFTDLGMGVLVDRTKSKYGMARPWLIRMALPTLLIFPIMFSVPFEAGTNFKLVYIIVTNFIFLGIIYTAITIPYGALFFLETKNQYERSKIGVFRLTTAYLSSAIVNILLIPSVNLLGGGRGAWIIIGVIYGVISMLTLSIAFFSIKERNIGTEKIEKIPLYCGIKFLFKNKYWVMVMAVNLIINLIYTLANGTSVYYSKYVLGNADLIAVIGMSDLLFASIGFIILGPIIKKTGNRNTVLLGMFLAVTGCLLRTLNPYHVTYTIVTRGLTTIGGTAVLAIIGAMIADTVKYGEWKTGKRLAGLSSSAVSFSAKFGAALWTGTTGWIFAISGYDGLLDKQPKEAVTMIIFLNIYFPLICYAAIAIIMIFYRLDKDYPKIAGEIDTKNNLENRSIRT